MLGVALYKATKLSRELMGHPVSKILHVLIRDQFFYYVMCALPIGDQEIVSDPTTTCSVVVITVFKIAKFYLPYTVNSVINILGYTDLLSLFGCRMLINIKEVVGESLNIHRDSGGGYGISGNSELQSTVIETIEFSENLRSGTETAMHTEGGLALNKRETTFTLSDSE